MKKKWLILQIALVLFTGALLNETVPDRLNHLNESYDPFTPPPLSNLSPELVSILTLGHKHVYDDFISLWLLQILMGEHKSKDPEPLLKSIRAVIAHKPKLETTFLLSCITLFETYSRPELCQDIVLQGIATFPNSWRLPVLQGYIHAFLLEEPVQAASFFKMAGARPKAPAWVQGVVDKLLKKKTLNPEDLQKSLEILKNFSKRAKIETLINRIQNLKSKATTEDSFDENH